MSRPLIAVAAFALATLGAGPAVAHDGAAAAQPTSAGTPETLQPDSDENLQWAAAVVRVDELPNQGDLSVKLFGAAGGDPAMNGLNTYLAFFEDPAEGWRLFRIGDFLDYRILAASPGRVELELQENILNDATSEVGSRSRRVTLSWTGGPDGTPPASVTMTPAR